MGIPHAVWHFSSKADEQEAVWRGKNCKMFPAGNTIVAVTS